MKRDFLKKLELTDEQINTIMAENGKELQDNKEKQETLQAQINDLTSQITSRDKDINDLKKEAGANTGLAEKYSELQKKYKEDSKAWETQNAQIKLDNALNNALTSAKVRNAATIRPLLDMDVIKLTDSGELVGLNEQLDSIKSDNGYLFDEGTEAGYEPKGGTGAGNDKDSETSSLSKMASEARIIK